MAAKKLVETREEQHDVQEEEDFDDEMEYEEKKKSLTRKSKYDEGEVVYVDCSGVFYKAKILESLNRGREYFVHYHGFSTRYDEKKLVSDLFADNPEIEEYAKKRKQQCERMTQSKKTKPSKKSPEKAENNRLPTKKRKRETFESQLDYSARGKLTIQLPLPLKRILVNDWEQIQNRRMLVSIPREPTVQTILSDFLEFSKQKKNYNEEVEKANIDISKGLGTLFDRVAGKVLLYQFERMQYDAYREIEGNQYLDASSIYGGEHLLRLLVRLPGLYEDSNVHVQKQELSAFQGRIKELVSYLVRNRETVFAQSPYEKAHPLYLRAYANVTNTKFIP